MRQNWRTLVKSNAISKDIGNRILIVTHDVDWPIQGPNSQHILSRKERFAPEIIQKVMNEGFNPYFGIPKIMEIEEKFGIHSTFFFRPKYDDESEVDKYKETIKSLLSGGWEVGLHSNNTSTLEQVLHEKTLLEKTAGRPVYGSRAHYLRVYENTFLNLKDAGIRYDSSLSFNKEQIEEVLDFLKEQ